MFSWTRALAEAQDDRHDLTDVIFGRALSAETDADVDVCQLFEGDACLLTLAVEVEEPEFLFADHKGINLEEPHRLQHFIKAKALALPHHSLIDVLELILELSYLQMLKNPVFMLLAALGRKY